MTLPIFSQGNVKTSFQENTSVLQMTEKINPDLTLSFIIWLFMQIPFV